MKLSFLILALIVGGCACSWRDITHHSEKGGTLYMSSELSDECNGYLSVYIKHPEHPERYLYVEDNLTGPCQHSLRPAFASDTGRTYRWDELPNVFEPCP